MLHFFLPFSPVWSHRLPEGGRKGALKPKDALELSLTSDWQWILLSRDPFLMLMACCVSKPRSLSGCSPRWWRVLTLPAVFGLALAACFSSLMNELAQNGHADASGSKFMLCLLKSSVLQAEERFVAPAVCLLLQVGG